MHAKLNSKGQITIPKAVRDRLQIKPGDKFKFFFHGDGVVLVPVLPVTSIKGMFPKPPQPVSEEDMDRAIEEGVMERFLRSM